MFLPIKKGNNGEVEEFRNLVINCLKKSEKKHLKSICIAAISEAFFWFPIEICAEIILDAVEFYAKNMNESINEIRIVNDNITSFLTFKLKFEDRYLIDKETKEKLQNLQYYYPEKIIQK